ncbi:MAG: diguanylate cyclase [Burkholderiales bacterium]|nr:diguanylate cyclase [Burkholderiales bacterium]
MAVNLVRSVSVDVIIDGRAVSVSPSIGISVFPDDGDTADELIRHADTAMYRAKNCGRSNYQFFPRAESFARVRRSGLPVAFNATRPITGRSHPGRCELPRTPSVRRQACHTLAQGSTDRRAHSSLPDARYGGLARHGCHLVAWFAQNF